MDLDAVRTFVAAADAGQFQDAAAALSITQQAVSKRIAALEKDLGVRLFTRTARGAQLTVDGQAFLPHARELLRVAGARRRLRTPRPTRAARRRPQPTDRAGGAAAGLPPRASRHRAGRRHPRRRRPRRDRRRRGRERSTPPSTPSPSAARHLPDAIRTARVIDEHHELLVGPRHALANARSVTPAQLAEHRIWMPGMAPGTEWADYYDELAAAFGLTIDVVGPVFGNEALLAEIADSAELATLVGERSRYLWPDSYDLRRIPVRDPAPIYPMSLIWRDDNPHPALRHCATTSAPDECRRPTPRSGYRRGVSDRRSAIRRCGR